MREIEQKEISIQTKRICPVCGGDIHELNLPDAKGVVEENLYNAGGVRIVDSEVILLVDCEHRYANVEVTLDNPHAFTMVVKCTFDSQGDCTRFEIADIRAGG